MSLLNLDIIKLLYAQSSLDEIRELANAACKENRPDILEYCHQHGLDISENNGMSLLMLAVPYGSTESMEWLTNHGIQTKTAALYYKSILYEFLINNSMDIKLIVRIILFIFKHGEFKNKESFGELLCVAIQHNYLYIAQILLQPDIYDVNVPDLQTEIKYALHNMPEMSTEMRDYLTIHFH